MNENNKNELLEVFENFLLALCCLGFVISMNKRCSNITKPVSHNKTEIKYVTQPKNVATAYVTILQKTR